MSKKYPFVDLAQSNALNQFFEPVMDPIFHKSHTHKSYTHKSDMRVVTSIHIGTKKLCSLPKELLIVMEKSLELGVPVQIQIEIVPTHCQSETASGLYTAVSGLCAYDCSVNYIKARIKPGTKEFIGNEEASLNHIINGTEESEEAKKRIQMRIEKAREKDEANRFTGLEI